MMELTREELYLLLCACQKYHHELDFLLNQLIVKRRALERASFDVGIGQLEKSIEILTRLEALLADELGRAEKK